MSFCFNFPNPEADNENKYEKTCSISTEKESPDQDEEEIPAIEMKLDWKHLTPCKNPNTIAYDFNETSTLVSISPKHLETILKENSENSEITPLKEALQNQCDLIPNKYEGGLQIWECSIDLTKYISNQMLSGSSVAEIGCGAGLPGLCALKKGASTVLFQDFNSEVLTKLTLPNILLNCYEERERCYLFSGDWGSLPQAVNHSTISLQKFDIILTAETIYNTKNYQKLINIFDFLLKENGYILIAAKNYYFGVGGGTRQFEESLKEDGRFTSSVCWTKADGLSREIICAQRKKT
ncbi:Hypothetical predicted protein [Octopus vulgaris]|uniref:protein-histidine N-methyltransferase n=1 Tax=Octopus vulgaris TaxID=6645 RepID=A0AA36APL9_OCTVU|nr:Hypothetical predicted protein [Octopus vulgaris]